jgi:hypothetical protein
LDLANLFDRQAPGGERAKQIGFRPGEIEPGEPVRVVEDDHLPIVNGRDVRTGFGREQRKGVRCPVWHRTPQAGEAEPVFSYFGEFRRRDEASTFGEPSTLGAEVDDRRSLRPRAGGLPIETPFGTLVSPNITPDRETGIGAWTDDEFVSAMQNGTRRGGEHLYPAMPYTYYTKTTREDVLAIRAYLETVDPVHNEVKVNQLPFPFDVRASMVGWNELYFKRGIFEPVAGKTDEWNRGAYLVEGLGHCGLCHTTKNAMGGDETTRALQGGTLQG